MSKFTLAVFGVMIFALGIIAGQVMMKDSKEPPLAQGPFRPRPRPAPEPEPPPLAEGDRVLFNRLLPHFRPFVDQRVQEGVANEMQAAIDTLDSAQVKEGEVVVVGDAQGLIGSMLAGKIIDFIKKWSIWVIRGLIGAAMLDFLKQFWWIIVPVFVGVVTFIAWPAGWSAAKFAK